MSSDHADCTKRAAEKIKEFASHYTLRLLRGWTTESIAEIIEEYCRVKKKDAALNALIYEYENGVKGHDIPVGIVEKAKTALSGKE